MMETRRFWLGIYRKIKASTNVDNAGDAKEPAVEPLAPGQDVQSIGFGGGWRVGQLDQCMTRHHGRSGRASALRFTINK